MEKSESIKAIATAIGKFTFLQNKIKKDATNPFFKSKYATLSNILESIEDNLREAGLVFTQFPDGDSLTTILVHPESGEYLQASYDVHSAKSDPQSWGSAITYARRYALSSILGLNVDDDDAETAQKAYRKPPTPSKPVLTPDNKRWSQAVKAFEEGTASIDSIRKHWILSDHNALLIDPTYKK